LADDLCATWVLAPAAQKCLPTQTCCSQTTSFPPNCTSPLTCPSSGQPPNCGSNFVTQENYAFGADGSYALTFLVATGSCPSGGIQDSTVQTGVATFGGFTNGGANNISGNWTKLTYQPNGGFSATLVKSSASHPCFFTPGFKVGGGVVGPCTDLTILFNDPDYGCPCNGTWTVAGFQNGSSPATRTFNKTSCVSSNGTSTCPEDYYFSVNPRYGSYRVFNISVNNVTMRQLDITRPVFDQNAGWSDNVTYLSYTANFTCPDTATGSIAPTAHSAATMLSSSAAGLAIIWMLV